MDQGRTRMAEHHGVFSGILGGDAMTDLPKWAVDEAASLAAVAMENLLAMGDQPVEDRTNWLANFIARALADAAKPKWQPVGDEHKDGDWWLGCYAEHYTTNGFAPIPIRWGTYHPNSAGKACWRTVSGHKVWHITHVMPLPAAPEVG